MLSFNDWRRSQNWDEASGIPFMFQQQQMYDDYVKNFYNQNPSVSPTQVPGAPTFTPPEPFSDLDEANQFGYNQALGLYSQGPTIQGFGDTSQQAQQMIQNVAGGGNRVGDAINTVSGQFNNANPFLSGFGNISSNPYTSSVAGSQTSNPYQANFNTIGQSTNPYTGQIASGYRNNPYASTINMSDANPFMQSFMDFQGNQNQYFDATVDRALDKVTDQVNSQFGLAGRTGSGAHQGVMTERLGDVANQMYSDNFGSNMDRYLQSLSSGANVYSDTAGRNLAATGMGIDAFNTDQNRALNYLKTAANLSNTDLDRALQATGMGADVFSDDQSRNLQALTTAGNFSNQDVLNELQALSQGADVFNTDQLRSLQAAGMIPGLSNARYTDALMLQGLGQDQDAMSQSLADSGWQNLQRYMDIIRGSRETPEEPDASSTDKLLGLLGLGGGLLSGGALGGIF